jgi:hypothetical protein
LFALKQETVHGHDQSVSREEFRKILCKLVACVRTELDVPGVSPFNPTEIVQWLNQITPEDVAAVWDTPDDRK